MREISKAPRVRGGRGFVVALALLCVGLAVAPADAQTLRAFPPEHRIIPPPELGATPSTSLSPGDQLQVQLYRDELATRQRRLEDRSGSTSPFAGIQALRNQERLNSIGR